MTVRSGATRELGIHEAETHESTSDARSEGRRRVRLDGALCLVSGAGSGIGRATAIALASRGARVLATDIDLGAAKQTAADCEGLPYELDVADRGGVAELADALYAEHGTLDVLVNNAGVGMSARFLDTGVEDWDWILGINLMGVVHCCAAFGARMVERRMGHVVNVSSGLGYFPTASEPAYCTTKAAVLALSRGLRADWGSKGVGVSVVCPGLVDTGIIGRTRFRGDAAKPQAVRRVHQLFARRGHPPRLVADAIVGAIENDRPVVPVGAEARIAWALRGLVPSRVADRVASISERTR
jgi:2-hydroxycyclohexanecarboxyl-CoA dehydrogenase